MEGKNSGKYSFYRQIKKNNQNPGSIRSKFPKSTNGGRTLSALSGILETGEGILRDFINATLGLSELGELSDQTPESLMRMLGPKGNPTAKNLLDTIVKSFKNEKGFFSKSRQCIQLD